MAKMGARLNYFTERKHKKGAVTQKIHPRMNSVKIHVLHNFPAGKIVAN